LEFDGQEPIVVVSSPGSGPVRLPSIKGNFFDRFDIRFTVLILVSFLVHGGIIAYLNSVPISNRKMTLEEIPERFARIIMDKPVVREKPQAKGPAGEKEGPEKEDVKSPEQTAKEVVKQREVKMETARKNVAQRAKKVQQKLQNAGVFSVLTSSTGGKGPAYVDVLGSQGKFRSSGNLDQALEGIDALKRGGSALDQPVVRSRDASGSREKADITNLINDLSSAQESSLSKRGSIQYKKPEIIGEASNSAKRADEAINQVVRKNHNSIKISYERELKKNPQLAGKITIRFVIEEDGTVSEVEIMESTMNCPAMERSIQSQIKRWKFEPLSSGSGSTSVTYPFVFQPT
jgi:TonB family protein